MLIQALQSISPQCALKFKARITSNVSNILTEEFAYDKSGGEVLLEFDVDQVTMKKMKEIAGDSADPHIQTPPNQLFSLLFE